MQILPPYNVHLSFFLHHFSLDDGESEDAEYDEANDPVFQRRNVFDLLPVLGEECLADLRSRVLVCISEDHLMMTRSMENEKSKEITLDDLRSMNITSLLGKAVQYLVRKDPDYSNTLNAIRIRMLIGDSVTNAEKKKARENSTLQQILRNAIRTMIGGWKEGREKLIAFIDARIDKITTYSEGVKSVLELCETKENKEMIYIPETSERQEQSNEVLAVGHHNAYVSKENLIQIVRYCLYNEDFPPSKPATTVASTSQKKKSDSVLNTSSTKKTKTSIEAEAHQQATHIVSLGKPPHTNDNTNSTSTNTSQNPTPSSSPSTADSTSDADNSHPIRALLLDNFSTHRNGDLDALCHSYRTLLLFFPANMTWFLQPLDLTVNLVVKSIIRKITCNITNYKVHNPDEDFSYFNKMERRVMQNIFAFNQVKVSTIVNGFNTMFSNLLNVLEDISKLSE